MACIMGVDATMEGHCYERKYQRKQSNRDKVIECGLVCEVFHP